MTYDADFLARLRQRDPATCTWFVYHFTPILDVKLRYKFRDHCTVEDLRHETFCRVFTLVDRDRVREPAKFGSFVRGVCECLILEYFHKKKAASEWPEGFEPIDPLPPVDEFVAGNELRDLLRNDLAQLPGDEEKIIRDIYFHERDRGSMARERGITITGLNVKLCRALKHLRAQVFERINV
jgi:RNA polymerase sigma factor (sigma-70 family)